MYLSCRVIKTHKYLLTCWPPRQQDVLFAELEYEKYVFRFLLIRIHEICTILLPNVYKICIHICTLRLVTEQGNWLLRILEIFNCMSILRIGTGGINRVLPD